jgi:two-component system, NtrC family, sensor kinase
MPSLFVVQGRDQGKIFNITANRIRIGRDPNNGIQLIDSEVSRCHAELVVRDDGRCDLVDLDSSNGSILNGERVDRRALKSGDRIQIGQTILIFTGNSSPSSMRAAHSVDIVSQAQATDHSRIVSSWSPIGSLPGSSASGIESISAVAPSVYLEEEAKLDRKSLDVMYQTSIAVGRTTHIPELLDRVLRIVFDWVGADRGCLMLRDNETGELQPAARCDRDDQPGDRMSISRTILDFVMERREGVRTTDAREDARWDAANSIVQQGIREALCVPLLGRYDCVGAIYVDTYTKSGKAVGMDGKSRFSDEQLRLMIAIGHQAALAIEDTFYYSSLLQNERLAAIGQTIAILSHHMKNILQGMRGGSYLIGAGLDRTDPDAIRRGWNIVEKNQERISNLVLDMLSYSKDREPDRVTANLNETIADVVELMQVRADEQACNLQFEPDTNLPDCSFDPEAMHRALLNLVSNALDAVAEVEQAMVAIACTFAPKIGWTIEVRDNGPGIEIQDRDKVFSLFESRKGAQGTGLGLPVTQKIVAEHGGTIELIDHEGPGCIFRILLPLPGPEQPSRLDDVPETPEPPSVTERTLYA